MMKVLGFLTGVCLTAAGFALMLDRWPQRQSEETSPATLASDVQPLDAMSSMVGEVAMDVEVTPPKATVGAKTDGSENSASSAAGLIKAAALATDSTIPLLAPRIQDGTGQAGPGAVQVRVGQSTTAQPRAIAARAEDIESSAPDQVPLIDPDRSDPTRSHIFWSPFRSEWAARGFAGRMSSATQITIEVVEVGSGRYRAAFDYQDESQRLERIRRIESITGLELE